MNRIVNISVFSFLRGIIVLLVHSMLCFNAIAADVSTSFEGWSDGSYAGISNWNGWETNNALAGSPSRTGSKGIRLNDDSGENEYLMYENTDGNGKDGGLGTISFYYRHWDADGTNAWAQVQYSTNGGGSWTDVGAVLKPTTTSWTLFTNDVNVTGDNILIRVKSVDDHERFCIDDFSITDYAGCTGAPDAFNCSAASDETHHSFVANWQSSTCADNYYLYVYTDAGYTNMLDDYNGIDVGAGTSYVVEGLAPNTIYYYKIRAQNNDGDTWAGGTCSATTLSSISCGGGIGAPHFSEDFESGLPGSYSSGSFSLSSGTWDGHQIFRENQYCRNGSYACRINDDIANAHMTAPAVNGISRVEFKYCRPYGGSGSFELQKSVGGGPYTTIDTETYDGSYRTLTTYTFDVNDNSNNIRIRVVNDDNSAHLTIEDFVIYQMGTASAPNAPTVLAADNKTSDGFRARWSDNVSGNADYFVLDVAEDANFNASTTYEINHQDVGYVLNETLSGLSGSTYYYRVRAYKDGCSSDNSAVETVNLCAAPSDQATNLQFTNISDNSMELKWDVPASGCDGYVVKINTVNSFSNISSTSSLPGGNNSPWDSEKVIYTDESQRNLVITDLDENTTYYYKVYAYNNCSNYEFNNSGGSNVASVSTNARATNQSVCEDGSVSFSVNITNIDNVEYQWREKEPSGSYTDLSDDGTYSGVNTTTLSIDPVTNDMNGNEYYCEITHKHFSNAKTPVPIGSYCLANTRSLTLTVYPKPAVPTIQDTVNNCDNTDIIRNEPPAGVTWYWQGTNANGTGTSNSNNAYNVTSDDTYYLRARSDEGCWSDNSASQSVEIRETPTTSLTVIPDCGIGEVKVSSDLNQQQTFILLDDAGNPLSPNREWSGSDSEYTFGGLMDGNYTGKVINQGCEAALAGPVNLTNNPVPAPPLMSDNGVCGDNINITLTADTVGSEATHVIFYEDDGTTFYDWDDTEPFTCDVPGVMQGSPVTILAAAYSSSTFCFSEKIAATATAIPSPGNPTAIGGVSSPRCQQDITDTYTTSATDVDYFEWEIQNATEGTDFDWLGTASTVSEQVQWYAGYSGTATIRVRAVNDCGNSNWESTTLQINPNTSITTQPTAQIECEGATASFTIAAVGGAPITYQWQKDNAGAWNNLTNGGDISGATSNNLQIANLIAVDADNYRCVVSSCCGSDVTSNAVSLTVQDNVSITAHPTDATQCEGTNVTFTVTASGEGPLTYQWKKDGTDIGGETNASLTINNISTGDAADYTVEVSGSCGSPVTSNAATLTVQDNVTITAHPTDATQCEGTNATFTVTAAGEGPLTYQWKKDGSNIVGATNASLTINNISTSDAADYTVEVSGTCGSPVTSNAAMLTVNYVNADAGTDQTISPGAIANLDGSASGGSGNYSYNWSPADSLVDETLEDPTTINLYTINIFTLTVTDDNTGCKDTDQVTINISGSVLSVTASADNLSICNGDSTDIHAAGSGGTTPYSYTWSSLPSGFNASSTDTMVKPAVDTKYIVEIEDAFNNTATDTLEIVVNDNPVAEAGDSTNICNGDSKIIGGSPTATGGTGPGTYIYSWNNGGDLNDDAIANPEALPSATTTYTVIVTDGNGCEATDKIQIIVYEIPVTDNIKNLKTR